MVLPQVDHVSYHVDPGAEHSYSGSSSGVSDEVLRVLCCCPISLNLAATQPTILMLCTCVLIADPLYGGVGGGGDEELVLLLSPDSPSPPDYFYSLSVCGGTFNI